MTTQTAETQAETPIPTLFTRPIRPHRNWAEWLEEWQKAETYGAMIGLLHCGFSVRVTSGGYNEKKYYWFDRIIFYFSIADGMNCSDFQLPANLQRINSTDKCYDIGMKSDSGSCVIVSGDDLRMMLARKAFDLLCTNFFKGFAQMSRSHDNFMGYWEGEITNMPHLLPAIMNFFRVEVEKSTFGDRRNIRNLVSGARSHNSDILVGFFLNLSFFLWKWQEKQITWMTRNQDEKIESNQKILALLDEAQPWMVDVLNYIEELKVLEPYALKLRPPCVERLKVIAMGAVLDGNHHIKGRRPVENLAEACFAGSKAAWLLNYRDVMMQENKRLLYHRKVSDEMEKRREELKELDEKNKQQAKVEE